MSALARVLLIGVVAIAALMVLPGTALAPPRSTPGPVTLSAAAPAAPTRSALSPWQAADLRAQAALTADGVPRAEQLLPASNPDVSVRNGIVTPGSINGADPMGIADYGVADRNGTNVGTITYTTSVRGVLHLDSLNLLYPDSYGPDEYTAQLNAVATGINVHGAPDQQFWMQNVIYYYQSDHVLHLASAIVNFTGTSFAFPAGTILAGNGSIDPGFGYFNPLGGAIYAPEPFVLSLAMNLAVVDSHPAVYFNYSVSSPAGTESGSYDLVVFNATTTQPPAFQINGQALGATGYIPNDVELILGGDGGGSTTSALGIRGTMNLYIQPNGTAHPEEVPAAWSVGGETGETIEGVAEYATGGGNPTVHLEAGPSMEQALWGVAGAPGFGYVPITLHVSPANAFVFGSVGRTFDPSAAGWAYVPTDGTLSFNLPRGSYSFEFLLSDHDPVTLSNVRDGIHTVVLASDASAGIYTPLWAFSDGELAAISSGGVGSAADPYYLINGPIAPLNPLFGQFNDYMFPVFSGLLLSGTNAYVNAYAEPSFEVALSLASEQSYAAVLPLDNELSWFVYNSTHVSIVSNSVIGGWINYAVYGQASLVLWNSSDVLVAGNTFPVPSLGIIAFGGTANTFWGNVFSTALPSAPDTAYIENYGGPTALELYESGDLLYNNYFGTPGTASTPAYNPYDFSSATVLWHDRWNVLRQPATDVRVVNGWSLSGSILGLSFEGGNFWSNYGSSSDPYGVLPYNDGGAIVRGGDAVPLLPFALYAVTFAETGLPLGHVWSVTLNGITETSKATHITFWDPSGLYAFQVSTEGHHAPNPSIGAVSVVTSAQTVAIAYT